MITDKYLGEWAKQYKSELSPRILALISKASYDLYFGPTEEDDEEENADLKYPGFVSAVNEIKKALDDVSDMYVDVQSGEVMTKEPVPEPYEVGNPDYDEENPDDEPETITLFDEGEYVKYDRRAVLAELVGKELASYL